MARTTTPHYLVLMFSLVIINKAEKEKSFIRAKFVSFFKFTTVITNTHA